VTRASVRLDAVRSREREPALVQSVDRALTVLEILAKRGVAG
jgi:hypothetical protein